MSWHPSLTLPTITSCPTLVVPTKWPSKAKIKPSSVSAFAISSQRSCTRSCHWHSLLLTSNLSSQCELVRMVYGTCTTNKWRSRNSCFTSVEHESLLIHDFRHPTQHHAVAIPVLDRTSRMDCAENNKGSSRSVGQASVVSLSVSPVAANRIL
jgi:hypothetical protein